MRIFTVSSGKVSTGAVVGKLTLKGAGITIPAIFVGEEGRGRDRGVMPVQLLPEQQKEWEDKGTTTVEFGEIGQTKAGKPKLNSKAQPGDEDAVIVVMPTTIGFRGGNNHTGDRIGEEEYEEWGEKKTRLTFDLFPGEIIVSGTIAQGDAGRMGSGSQYIATMPKDVVFRTSYSGRLYGAPSAHYYVWTGERLLAATWEERAASDLF